MNLLLASLLGAAPAPAFDVPIREIELSLDGPAHRRLVEVRPGRCELPRPWPAEPARVTARLSTLHVEDLRSLLMVSLDDGYSATSWGPGDTKRAAEPNVSVRVSALSEAVLDPLFDWTTVLTLTPEGRLNEAWRLYSLFSYCNLGEAVDVWVNLLNGPTQQRHLTLALLTEWMIWANRERDFLSALPGRIKECREGRCEALPDALREASQTWAESPSPRSIAPLEGSPPVEASVKP